MRCLWLVLLLPGCAAVGNAAAPAPTASAADYAASLAGKRALAGGGKRFGFDSVGLVRAAFAEVGVDVFAAPAAADPQRTGVEILYQYAALNGRLHSNNVPRKGDLVFFGKTRDADGDGTPDPVSHVGVVVEVDAAGTATIATATQSHVALLRLNRLRPSEHQGEHGEVLNSSLFTALGRGKPQLVSQLFYTFASLDQAPARATLVAARDSK